MTARLPLSVCAVPVRRASVICALCIECESLLIVACIRCAVNVCIRVHTNAQCAHSFIDERAHVPHPRPPRPIAQFS